MNTSNESIQNLKPCPFCGGKADFDYDDSGYNWVFCTKCGVTTDTDMHDEFDARLRLAKAWNTRADEWISVDDESFSANQTAMVYIPLKKDYYMNIASSNDEGDLYDWDGGYIGYHASQITHWMRIQQLPKV